MTKKFYAVFGLGKSGKATLEYLGDKVAYAWDDNAEVISDKLQPPSKWDWSKIEALILAPGIPLTHPKPHYIVKAAHKHNVKIICDIEVLWQDNQDSFFIGITGTNGKSTTTALLTHILQKNGFDAVMGGNIGNAALGLGKHKYYILEMSSYQLDLIDKTKFNIAIWLNISPDHIDRHGDLEGYIAAKKHIFKNGNDKVICGIDDEHSQKIAEEFSAIQISKNNNLGDFENIPGIHNMQNINAAYAVCKELGLEDNDIFSAIKTFPGLEHRIEQIRKIGNVVYVNDSKATNAESTAQALATFDNIYWIAGGVAKEGGIEPLQEFFSKIKKAYLIGEAAEEFATSLEGKVDFEITKNIENAIIYASNDCENGVILLSPACASFDQFKNFEERGDFFRKLVLNLIDD